MALGQLNAARADVLAATRVGAAMRAGPTRDMPAPAARDGEGDDVVIGGRTFRRVIDPATGRTTLTHASAQTDPQGNRLTLGIRIVVHPDGSAERTVDEGLRRPDGLEQDVSTHTSFSASGMPVHETVRASARLGAISVTEDARTDFTQGRAVRNESTTVRTQRTTDAAGATQTVTQTTRELREDGGRPISDATPAAIDFREEATTVTPGQGLTKKDARHFTVLRHATGTADKLTWEPIRLVVRFDGAKGRYMQREFEFAVNDKGEPLDPSKPKLVREVDTRHFIDKASDQARIWGSFGGWLSIMAGVQMIGGSLHSLGKALVFAGAGASFASTAGNWYALLGGQNSASPYMTAVSTYDSVINGLLAFIVAKLPGGNTGQLRMASGAALALTGVGNLAAAGHMLDSSRGIGSPLRAQRDPGDLTRSIDIPEIGRRVGGVARASEVMAAPTRLAASSH